MFSHITYSTRRKQLLKKLSSGVVVFFGHSESPRNYSANVYPFRQDSTFLYYTGLSRPALALILDVESGQELLYADPQGLDHIVWEGKVKEPSQLAIEAGIELTKPFVQFEDDLQKLHKQGRKIHFMPPYRADTDNLIGRLLSVATAQMRDFMSDELVSAVISQRNYKTDEEIEEINKAVSLSVDMHRAAMRLVRPGMRESEVVAELTKISLKSGGSLAFPIIATINGQVLHNTVNSNIAQDGQLFLLDAGAEVRSGYCGDLSSTFPVSPSFSLEQKEIYTICLASHERAISLLKPGISFKEIYFEAARVILDGMKNIGLFKGNVEDGLAAGAHGMFLPCGLGHMMGLDVHDMENLGEAQVGWDGVERSEQFGIKSLRLGRKLEPGFVLTIEPGIYFIPELIDQWRERSINSEFLDFDKLDSFKTFGGIRNEEDFLITQTGAQLLGKSKPKTVEEIETERAYAF